MILFKAVPISDANEPWFARAETIVGHDSFTWVDRYREAGSVEIVGPMHAGLDTQLPLGTLVSHTGSYGWCMIERHEYPTDEEGTITFKATGRSLDGWLAYRVVGEFENNTVPSEADGPPLWSLASDEVWTQAKNLINTHALGGQMTHLAVEVIDGIADEVVIPSGTLLTRTLERKDVYSTLQELLAVQDLGIKVVRGLSTHPDIDFDSVGSKNTSVGTTTYFLIHAGQDRSDTVAFSLSRGDLRDMTPLESNELNYTNVAVVGSYAVVHVNPSTASKYWRRTCVIDGSELDRAWTEADGPVGYYGVFGTEDCPGTYMTELGNRIISVRSGIHMTDAAAGPNNPYSYGVDYDIGDIVLLEGPMRLLERRRITEHTTIVTKDEIQEIPTFSVLGE
jgi:Siphovirus ReqiPepy6 Gp37-like protein